MIITDPVGLAELIPEPKVPTLPFLAGFTLAGDRDATEAYFADKGMPTRTFDDAIVVAPEQAAGTYIRFVGRAGE